MSLQDGVSQQVADWLQHKLPESELPFRLERISGGYSMLTYRLYDATGHIWVLRHPPAGQSTGGAHDTDREARVMAALYDTTVPVPRVRVIGMDDEPLGIRCHITDFVPGHVLADAETAREVLTPEALRSASMNIVDALAALHKVDPDEVGLGDLGPRANYVARQLHRWRKVIASADDPESKRFAADLNEVADLLERQAPPDVAPHIVHGDYRLGNSIVSDDGQVRALLDWELATLGDPLADVGLLAAFWTPPPEAMLGVRQPTSAPGSITLDEALQRYADQTGADLVHIGFHRALAAWRLACTAYRSRTRYASGSMQDGTDVSIFVQPCLTWSAIARDLLSG